MLHGRPAGPPLQTVSQVDLTRYAGLWYEIARYPVFFERGLSAVTAFYSLNPDGTVGVVNSGHKCSVAGPLKRIVGKARVADRQTNAKLKVRFFRLFEGDYWIIDLDKDYQYAVVGEPRRKTLWVLGRAPVMDESLYRRITSQLAARGYDASRLVRTPQ